jgi:hypothetical protein
MDILQSLEYPLPVLSVDSDRIEASSGASFTKSINVKNRGGGLLEGEVFCNSPYVFINPQSFSGNQAAFEVQADLSSFGSGEMLETSLCIVSNGGEKVLPVKLSVELFTTTADNARISSLEDLEAYAAKDMEKAAQLFRRHDFRAFLSKGKRDFTNLYDFFIKEKDPIYSLESFLRASTGKKPPRLEVSKKRFSIPVMPFAKDEIHGQILVRLEGYGMITDKIAIENGGKWLSVPSSALQSLKGGETESIPFAIAPEMLPARRSCAVVALTQDPEARVAIEAVKLPLFKATLSKETYSPDQEGRIIIENFSGVDILAEVIPEASYLRFDAMRYPIRERAEIPFRVKVTALQSFTVRRQLSIPTSVTVRVMVRGEVTSVKLPLNIGEWE